MLFALTLVTMYQFRSAEDYSNQIEDSRLILVAVQNLNRGLLNAETGQRGFLLTSQSTYLDSYVKGVAATRAAVVDIEQKLNGGRAQQEQVTRLTALVYGKLDELQQTVNFEKAHRHNDALAIVQTGSGKNLMDKIQQITGTLLTNERERLKRRSAAIEAGRLSTIRLFKATQIGMLVLFANAFFFVHRSLRSKRAMADALRESEAKLSDSERHIREITSHVPAIIAEYDLNHRCLFVSDEVRRAYNIDPSAIIGKTQQEIRGDEGYRQVAEELGAVLRGEMRRFELLSPFGATNSVVQKTLIPKRDVSGAVDGYYAMTVDITERKRAEMQLAEKEHMLRTITDNLPVLISYTDSNEVIRFSNSTYKKWLNHDPGQALGHTLIEMMGEKMYERRRKQIRTVLSGQPVEFQDTLDAPDGPRYHQVSYLPDIESGGRVAGFFALTMDITALKTIERQLDELARQDMLTHLPNRRHFEEKLEEFLARLRREPSPYALLFLDVDHFKTINDTHGHAVGDETLKHFASCLKASVRATDIIARLAGDEFVILLPRLHNRQEAEMVAIKIMDKVRAEFIVKSQMMNITTSIGIAYVAEGDVSSETLFACADKALYNAKDASRNGFSVIECNVVELREKPSQMRVKSTQEHIEEAATGVSL